VPSALSRWRAGPAGQSNSNNPLSGLLSGVLQLRDQQLICLGCQFDCGTCGGSWPSAHSQRLDRLFSAPLPFANLPGIPGGLRQGRVLVITVKAFSTGRGAPGGGGGAGGGGCPLRRPRVVARSIFSMSGSDGALRPVVNHYVAEYATHRARLQRRWHLQIAYYQCAPHRAHLLQLARPTG